MSVPPCRLPLLPLALLLPVCVAVAGANCQTPGSSGCESNSDCGDGQECRDGSCTASGSSSGTATSSSGGLGTYCDTDEECAADQFCNTVGHLCVSRHDCDTAADCQPGQECRDFNGDGWRDCGYPGCQSDEACVAELPSCEAGTVPRCVERACVCRSPCGGDCGAGKVCCNGRDTLCGSSAPCCADDPGPCGSAPACAPGNEHQPSGGNWDMATCTYAGAQCPCVELPPLPVGDFGNPSAIAVDGMLSLHVLAYNRTYGDVMLGRAPAGGALTWQFIDGLPADGAVTAGPSGPRGGVADPGPDVGRYLDVTASSSGVTHAVYQDRSTGVLLYARVDGGSVTRFILDANRETGVYPSVALDPRNGAPRVAYLTRRDDAGGFPVSRLRLAAARTPTPNSASDFTFHTLAEKDLRTVACQAGCPEGQGCAAAEPPALPACVPVASCNCDLGQFCTTGGCVAMHPGSNTQDVPQGVGMWPKVAVRSDGRTVVIAYNSFIRWLSLYTTTGSDPVESASAAWRTEVIDGNVLDAGEWPAVATDPGGTVHVAYLETTTRALKHAVLDANLAVARVEVIDDAGRANGQATDIHRLAEPALAAKPDGSVVVVYQDGTTGELLMALGTSAPFTRSTIRGGRTGTDHDGWWGFSNDVAARGAGQPVISTVRRQPDADPPLSEMVLLNWP